MKKLTSVFLLCFVIVFINRNYPNNLEFIERKFNFSPRIFCIILTQPKYLKRARAVQESWANKCDKYTFALVIPNEWLNKSNTNITSKKKQEGFEIIYDNMNFMQPINYTFDSYRNLSNKIFQSFKYLYKYYNDFDFYLKADDDTFVFVDNLRKFLSDKNRTELVTYGFDFSCSSGFHSGGKNSKINSSSFNSHLLL